jgi:hypothetical protein
MITRATDGEHTPDEVYSASEISSDVFSGVLGGAIGHSAGEFVHLPDEPLGKPRAQWKHRTEIYKARLAAFYHALAKQDFVGDVAGGLLTHFVNATTEAIEGMNRTSISGPPPCSAVSTLGPSEGKVVWISTIDCN